MILRMPYYYKNFKCTADKCSDSCCIGWEIDIDSKTYEFYKTVGGDFGDKLKRNISEHSVPHFILDKHERCPFLNNKNLCEIFINLGEENLCGICTDHPRFFEWYDGIKEGGIGLCCEAAAEIIITQNQPFSYYDIPTAFEQADDYDDDFYSYLFEIREKIISHIQNQNIPFAQKLNNILYYAYNMQSNYDNFKTDILPVEQVDFSGAKSDIANILKEFSEFELLGKDNLFKTASEEFSEKTIKLFSDDLFVKALENIAVYFVWRHFLKSVYEEEFYSKIAFSVLSTVLIAVLCLSGEQLFSIEKLIVKSVYYSKEIEYNEANLNRIFDNFYENDEFSISKISSLLKFFSKF